MPSFLTDHARRSIAAAKSKAWKDRARKIRANKLSAEWKTKARVLRARQLSAAWKGRARIAKAKELSSRWKSRVKSASAMQKMWRKNHPKRYVQRPLLRRSKRQQTLRQQWGDDYFRRKRGPWY